MRAYKWLATVFVGLFVLAGAVQSATVTQCGSNICYEYDAAQAGVGMFGSPTLAGDSLIFLSPMFRAESIDGAGLDTASATFVIDRVYSMDSMDIMDITIYESGDYRIINGDDVSAELILDVENNNSAEFGSVDELFTATGDSSGQQEWSLLDTFDPSSEFVSSANDVKVSITDILTADTDLFGETAWIQKKLTLTAATVVPIPAAAWMFISALGVLGWCRKRIG